MATISTTGITVGAIIKSEHVLRIINALSGTDPIDIIVKGSLSTSGSLNVTGSTFLKGLPNVSRTNVITYDPTTGQLSYVNSASLGVITNITQPGGLNTQVQYNSGSVLEGNSNFRFIYNSSSLTLGTSTPTGLYSFAQGSSLTASGNFSHAQGSLTKATNISAHAEGESTLASGQGSHAEGQFTTASSNYSHAEGLGTIAAGNYQHVQGQYNITSSAESAFIIGNGTADNARRNLVFASGSQVQITGSLNVSGSITGSLFGTASFATSASRAVSASWAPSNAGGSNTQIQFNSGSVLIGTGTFTFNYQSQSLQQGFNITASGLYSHAEGNNTTSSGDYSHAEGWETIASGLYSHAEGEDTRAIGTGSHAEGFWTVASGSYQHVQGQFNQTSTAQSAFIIGNGTSFLNRRNLVFASGSQFQITGSLLVSGSITTTGDITGGANITATNYLYGNVIQPLNALITDGGGNSGIRGSAPAVGSAAGLRFFSNNNDLGFTFSSGSFISQSRELVRINLSGSVGIGTSTPQFTLDVSGSARVTNGLTVTGSLRGFVSASTIVSTTASIDLSTANFFTVTLVSGSTTHISASNIQPGQTTSIRVTQPNPGTGSVTFSSTFKQPDGYPYIPTKASNAVDILTIVSFDSTNAYIVNVNNLI